jgi:hypothetical protein
MQILNLARNGNGTLYLTLTSLIWVPWPGVNYRILIRNSDGGISQDLFRMT